MGVIWFSTRCARDGTVWARAVGLAVVVLIATPILIYFAWPVGAQTNPPPSINAPNNQGIVTYGQQGNNYINKDPRSWGFTERQWNSFKAALPPAQLPVTIQIRLNDKSSRGVRNQIVGLLQSIPGWQPADMGDYVTDTLGDITGIVIDVQDANHPPQEAVSLMNAFRVSGLMPRPVLRSGFGGVRIVIGAPPI